MYFWSALYLRGFFILLGVVSVILLIEGHFEPFIEVGAGLLGAAMIGASIVLSITVLNLLWSVVNKLRRAARFKSDDRS